MGSRAIRTPPGHKNLCEVNRPYNMGSYLCRGAPSRRALHDVGARYGVKNTRLCGVPLRGTRTSIEAALFTKEGKGSL